MDSAMIPWGDRSPLYVVEELGWDPESANMREKNTLHYLPRLYGTVVKNSRAIMRLVIRCQIPSLVLS